MNAIFVFPGQGSQKVGMLRELYDQHASVRERFAEADEALDFPLSQLIFDGPDEELVKTEFTQPAILTASVAAYELLAAEGVRPQMAAGHSLGEYSALVAAKSLNFADAVRTVRLRGRFMQEAVPLGEGAMAAIIRLDRDAIVDICAKISAEGKPVQAVNFNCPGQVVIAGAAEAVEKACKKMKEAGAGRAIMLNVSAPFHSSLMAPAAKRLANVLENIEVKNAELPIITNVDAKAVHSAAAIKDALIRQAAHPVYWEDSMHFALNKGMDTFVEIGPGKVLTGFMRKIDRGVHTENVEDSMSLAKTLSYLKGDAK